MKFEKYLQDAHHTSHMLRHLNYRALKSEIKCSLELMQLGKMSEATAVNLFGQMLEAEIFEVGHFWESCLWGCKDLLDDLFSTTNMSIRGDAAHTALGGPMGPLRLLDPLNLWLPIAALIDVLSRHRLLQITAAVKIERKFRKVIGAELRPGRRAADLLRHSPLSGNTVHCVRHQLEAAGDALLRLGLGAHDPEPCDPCSICLHDLVDPVRLPCGHRVCLQCVLPLFGHSPEEIGLDAATLRCPLCRATGPSTSHALHLDSLLARLGRGLSSQLSGAIDSSATELPHITAVVVSSLARLTEEAMVDELSEVAPIKRAKSLVPLSPPLACGKTLQHEAQELQEGMSFELI